MGPTALIYTRVSKDVADGRSPEEQEHEAREVCAREGWTVAEVITDSVGASRHSKGTRHGWERARRLIERGEVGALVTWEASRAQRDLNAYAQLRDLCAASGVLWSYSGKTYDMSLGDDRFRTGLDALLAEREAEEIAGRVQRALRANAAQGRPHGRRLFGYQRVYDNTTGALIGQEPHPDEAPVVARVFDEYLAGRGIRTIASGLNAEGITTGTGARWNDAQVRRVLVNPAYVARRVHQGEIVGEGDWPALVTVDRFERVQARLAEKRGSGTRQRSTARLLTAVARCGVCGGKLNVGHDRNGRKMYQCRTRFCVARDLGKLDEFVSAVVLARLARADVTEALAGAAPSPEMERAHRRAADLRSQLDEAVEEFTTGMLTAATLSKVEQRLLPMIEEAEREARHALVPGIDLAVPTTDLEGWWASLSPEVRREVVGVLLAAVVVMPTRRGARTFDPAAVHIEWRR